MSKHTVVYKCSQGHDDGCYCTGEGMDKSDKQAYALVPIDYEPSEQGDLDIDGPQNYPGDVLEGRGSD